MRFSTLKNDGIPKAKTPPKICGALFAVSCTGCNSVDSLTNLFNSYSTIKDAVNLINLIFTSNFNCKEVEHVFDAHSNHWDIDINPEDIIFALLNTSSRVSCGPDCIPTVLYKAAAHCLAEPLCHVFNLSVSTGTVPSCFKIGHVVPIPKTVAPCINDLRPITLLSLPSKIFERTVVSSVKARFLISFGPN